MITPAVISFSGSQWLWPTVAFLVVAAVALFWGYRSMRGPMRWICLTLKVLGLAALAACLLEPLWYGERAKTGANLIAVVADNSQGMQIRDEGDELTRGEHLQNLLDPEQAVWVAELGDTFELRRYIFDTRLQTASDFHELVFDGRASGIGTALKTVQERFQGRPLAGVILLTDGNATDLRAGMPDLSGMPPVYPVVVGETDAVRDISVQQVTVTETAFEDAPVTIQADVGAAGYSGRSIVARLIDESGATVQEQSARASSSDAVIPFRFQLKPDRPGLVFYQVVAEQEDPSEAGEEATRVNNQRVLVVDRDAGPYRILYVSGRPNWEFKFLNRALEEDPEINLVGLIRIAKREPRFEFLGRADETSNPLYRGFGEQSPEEVEQFDEAVLIRLGVRDDLELSNGFPRVASDLYDYHAVILDDLESDFFGPDQAALLQKFVSERGGGFMMLGGMESFAEGGYDRTPIGDMLPVYLGEPQNLPAPIAGLQMQLTREGWLEPWARLRDTESAEQQVRGEIDRFEVYNRIRGVKPGATVITTAQDPAGGETPGLVVQRFGRGRTAAMLFGDVWKWGMQDADAHVEMDKAWRQMARWLVADVPEQVALTIEPVADDVNGAVTLQVRVRNASYLPLSDAGVTVAVEPVRFGNEVSDAPDRSIQLRAEPSLREVGLYEATYVPRLTGGFKVTAVATNTVGAEIGRDEAGWSVDLAADEFRSLTPNFGLMDTLARRTGGRLVDKDELEDFVAELPNESAPVMESWSYPLWHTPAMFAFALGCLLSEWGLRRWKGMP